MSECETNDPMTAGQPGRTSCAEGDPRQRLGRLLSERGGDRDRPHRAHQDERRDDDDLPGLGEGDQRLHHPRVEAKRRVGVDDAEQCRPLLDGLPAAMHDLGHGDRVARRHRVELGAAVRLVGLPDERHLEVEVAGFGLPVGGLADRIAGRVQLVQHMGQPDEADEVVIDRVAPGRPLADERGALRRAEDHPVGGETDRPLRVTAVMLERIRGPLPPAPASSPGRGGRARPPPAGRPGGSAPAPPHAETRCRWSATIRRQPASITSSDSGERISSGCSRR